MTEFIQTGGSLAIIVIAITLILQALKPFIKKDKQGPDTFNDILTQHDHTKMLNEINRMVTVQNSHLQRIAEAQEMMAKETSKINDAVSRLPQKIAESLRRGNGHA